MRSSQPRFAWLLAGWCSVGIVVAQQDSAGGAGASGGTSGAGASSAFGSPAPSQPSGSGAAPSTPATPSGTDATGTGSAAGAADTGAGASSTFGAGATPRRAEEAPSTFSVSTGFGRAPQIFVSGEGRLAKPRFETKFATSIGFDDNVFQTPTNAQGIPEQVIVTEIQPAVPDQIVLVPETQTPRPVRIGAIRPAPQPVRLVPTVIPGSPAVVDEVVIPGVPAPKRQASAITRGTFSFNMQAATRRSLFTFDLNANADYYWSRPNDKTDYNGTLALIYVQRLTPRMQFTAAMNASYQSQPDYTQINTPTNSQAGEYLNFTSKFDLSYRWKPRISTVSSVGYNRLLFVETSAQSGDYAETTFGTEFRYLWTPRFTGVVEGRYSQIRYENAAARDADTYFALLGFDITVTRRATGTVRLGASMRQFNESGKKATAPYLETTLVYQLGKASMLSWNGRFGFEEPPDQFSEVLSLRSSVRVTHFFSSRLQGSLSLNGIQRVTTSSVSDEDQTEFTIDGTLSLQYTLTRHWTLNGYYTYTNQIDDPEVTSYFRNRVFVGAEYEF